MYEVVDDLWAHESGDPAAWRAPGRWWRPDEVTVTDGDLVPGLVYQDPDQPYRWQMVEATGGTDESALLGDFIDLIDQPDDAFARYAERWGMLLLCDHGLPATHDKDTLPESLAPGRSVTRETGKRQEPCVVSFLRSEPIETWRYWARQARALVVVIARLRDGKVGGDEEWAELRAPGPWARDWPAAEPFVVPVHARSSGGLPPLGKLPDRDAAVQRTVMDLAEVFGARTEAHEVAFQRMAAAETLQHWLTLAGAGLSVSWRKEAHPDVTWRSGGLFGALGMKLVLAATGVDGWAMCPGCTRPHVPSRQALRGTGRYCSDCRTSGVPARTRASRRYDRRRTDPTFLERERERLRAYRARQRTGGTSDG